MKAPELTQRALQWLRARYPEAHLLTEFSVSEYGGALVDVAAICPDQIVGVEIKGEGDSPSRMAMQGQMYSRVCRTMYLLPAPALALACDANKPPEWYMLRAPGAPIAPGAYWTTCPDSGLGWYATHSHRREAGLLGRRGEGYGLAPVALVNMVWSKEGTRFRDLLQIPKKEWPNNKRARAEYVSAHRPLVQIEKAVCTVLRERTWFDGKQVLKPEPKTETPDGQT